MELQFLLPCSLEIMKSCSPPTMPHCTELTLPVLLERTRSPWLCGLLWDPSSAPVSRFPRSHGCKARQEHSNPFYSGKTKTTVGFSLGHSWR